MQEINSAQQKIENYIIVDYNLSAKEPITRVCTKTYV